jgi:zeaxanthin glucosyltransferase
VVSNTFGDIRPYLSLTRHLVRAGDDVAWLSLPETLRGFASFVTDAGARILPTPPSTSFRLPSGAALGALFADPEQLIRLQLQYIDELPQRVELVRALLRAERPDVIASDRQPDIHPMQIPAALERIPHAYVAANLLHLDRARLTGELSAELRAQMSDGWVALRRLYRSFGVAYRSDMGHPLSPHLNTTFSTEAFTGARAAMSSTLVGPCIEEEQDDDFPWERLRPDGRTIYCSCGSVFVDEALYEIVAEAAATLDVQVVYSTGALSDPTLIDRLPGDVLGIPSVPQTKLLGKVRAFVTHGGLNSVNESLWNGTPMLVVPLALDQWLQGELVERAEAGVTIARPGLTVEGCRAALAVLLDPRGPLRDGALRIRDSYRATRAIETTCDLLRAMAASP